MTDYTFLGAVADDVGFYLLLLMFLACGTVVAFFARRNRVGLGLVASVLAVASVGAGAAGRSLMLDAAHSVSSMPGLSRADRERIVHRDEVEADYRLDGAVGVALLAGVVALLMGTLTRTAVDAGLAE